MKKRGPNSSLHLETQNQNNGCFIITCRNRGFREGQHSKKYENSDTKIQEQFASPTPLTDVPQNYP